MPVNGSGFSNFILVGKSLSKVFGLVHLCLGRVRVGIVVAPRVNPAVLTL